MSDQALAKYIDSLMVAFQKGEEEAIQNVVGDMGLADIEQYRYQMGYLCAIRDGMSIIASEYKKLTGENNDGEED